MWNNATSRLKGRTAESLSVNAALDSISTTLNGIYRKFEDDESLSLEKIRSFFVGKDKEYTTFLPVFDKFNEDVRQRVGYTISKDRWIIGVFKQKRHSEVELWRFVELYKGGEAAGRSHAA